MFLIFAMNRPDVLPVSDLGVRLHSMKRHGLAELPAPRECHALAEPWRPYRYDRELVSLESGELPATPPSREPAEVAKAPSAKGNARD